MRTAIIVCSLALIVAGTSVTQAAPAPFVDVRTEPVDNAINLIYTPDTGELVAAAYGTGSDGNPLLFRAWDWSSGGLKFSKANRDPGFCK